MRCTVDVNAVSSLVMVHQPFRSPTLDGSRRYTKKGKRQLRMPPCPRPWSTKVPIANHGAEPSVLNAALFLCCPSTKDSHLRVLPFHIENINNTISYILLYFPQSLACCRALSAFSKCQGAGQQVGAALEPRSPNSLLIAVPSYIPLFLKAQEDLSVSGRRTGRVRDSWLGL